MDDTSFTEKPGYPLPSPSPTPDVAKKPTKRDKILLIILLLAASHFMIALIGFGLGCLATRGGESGNSLAILPFTGDWEPPGAKGDWQAQRSHFLAVTIPDAIAKDVVNSVDRSRLKVIATHEVRDRDHVQNESPRQAGTQLDVRAVLSGKVDKDGRLNIQLIAVPSGELIWSESYQLGVDAGGSPIFQNHQVVAAHVRQKLLNER